MGYSFLLYCEMKINPRIDANGRAMDGNSGTSVVGGIFINVNVSVSSFYFSLIIGKVVNLEVNENFFDEEGRMDFEKAKPLSCTLGSKDLTFTCPRSTGKSADYSEMFIGGKEVLSRTP